MIFSYKTKKTIISIDSISKSSNSSNRFVNGAQERSTTTLKENK